jgi:hypothetical protein
MACSQNLRRPFARPGEFPGQGSFWTDNENRVHGKRYRRMHGRH